MRKRPTKHHPLHEQRTVLDLAEEKFAARLLTILPAPVEWSKQLTTTARSLLESIRDAIVRAFLAGEMLLVSFADDVTL